MTFVQIIIAFLIAYLCVYALINRVCQCIEHCATARAYSKFRESGMYRDRKHKRDILGNIRGAV